MRSLGVPAQIGSILGEQGLPLESSGGVRGIQPFQEISLALREILKRKRMQRIHLSRIPPGQNQKLSKPSILLSHLERFSGV